MEEEEGGGRRELVDEAEVNEFATACHERYRRVGAVDRRNIWARVHIPYKLYYL